MARWKLTSPHYLSSPGSEWEFVETDTGTGKQVRHRHLVPLYLDPKDPADCDRHGEIVVCHEGKGASGDKVFVGAPTPEMEPLDDEAREITEKLRHLWDQYGRGDAGYGEAVLGDFQRQLVSAAMSQAPVAKEIDELKEQMAELQKQNAELMKRVGGRRA